MKFADALKTLSRLEFDDKDAVLAAINKQVADIPVLQSQAQSLQSNLDTLLEIAGASEGNLEAKIAAAQTAIAALKTTETDYQAQLTAKENELTTLKRQGLYEKAATVAKANPTVFSNLLKNFDGDVQIEGDSVKLKPKDGEAIALSEYVEKNYPDYKPALFPTTQTSSLPTGGSNAKIPEPTDAVTAYQEATYGKLTESLVGK